MTKISILVACLTIAIGFGCASLPATAEAQLNESFKSKSDRVAADNAQDISDFRTINMLVDRFGFRIEAIGETSSGQIRALLKDNKTKIRLDTKSTYPLSDLMKMQESTGQWKRESMDKAPDKIKGIASTLAEQGYECIGRYKIVWLGAYQSSFQKHFVSAEGKTLYTNIAVEE